MIVSLLFAWVTVLFVIVTAFKYIARVSQSKKMNAIFHKIHIPVGILLILTGLLHGLIAGNFPDVGIADMRIGTVLFTLNWGTACFFVSVLLGISYLIRRILKKQWMMVHRVLTVGMLVLMIIHIADVVIQLPSRLLEQKSDSVDIQDMDKHESNDSVTFSGAHLNDGVYEGTAEGYKSTIKVSVTVFNGAVTDITILEENDTPEFFKRAKEIIARVIGGQSLEVDTVSGATYSSAGILNAVEQALESAVVDGELQKNDIELPTGFHHGHGEKKRKNRGGKYDD